MLSALEHEVIEKFRQLDAEAQRRVRDLILQEADAEPAARAFDFEAWLAEVEAIRLKIIASHGGYFPAVDAVSLLHDIRDGQDE